METFTASAKAPSAKLSAPAVAPPPPVQPLPEPVAADRLEPTPLETIGKTMLPAKPIRQVAPSTPEGIRNRIHGVIPVEVTVRIGKNGSVVSARASRAGEGSGMRAYLAQRASEAVRQWKFQPAKIGEETVPGELTVRFRFRRSGAEWN